MNSRSNARAVALCGLLFALAVALSVLEGTIPFPVPGVRPGLSNVVVMFCVFVLGAGYAVLLALLKAGFVLLTRGITGALLSLMGGLLSVGLMCLLARMRRHVPSLSAVSMIGAVAHNIGQLMGASFLLHSTYVWAYLPVLLVSGVAMGMITALLYKAASPALKKIDGVYKLRKKD
ncbi:Gx transporter family protein [Oscillospiraceae bacterium MB08-C2-2]|nr:Gx transporter family protein [Oscillospiraceae bacterium MB08-C2-2]